MSLHQSVPEVMPELAEVEFFRKEWDRGAGEPVVRVKLHPRARIFRDCRPAILRRELSGARLVSSEAHGKRILFRFRKDGGSSLLWLGLHLGMTGRLAAERPDYLPQKHDHLVLVQKERALVFADSRQFGSVRAATGEEPPEWWRDLPPPILSAAFTRQRMEAILDRRECSPIKAVLLLQEAFPGVGNWMADEILWQAGLHPSRPAGELTREQRKTLFSVTRRVCRTAMDTIGRDFRDPPPDWLFHQRWGRKGICPRTGRPLEHSVIAGRTTCWSPSRQH